MQPKPLRAERMAFSSAVNLESELIRVASMPQDYTDMVNRWLTPPACRPSRLHRADDFGTVDMRGQSRDLALAALQRQRLLGRRLHPVAPAALGLVERGI